MGLEEWIRDNYDNFDWQKIKRNSKTLCGRNNKESIIRALVGTCPSGIFNEFKEDTCRELFEKTKQYGEINKEGCDNCSYRTLKPYLQTPIKGIIKAARKRKEGKNEF